jgi:hypothetical protein
MPYAKNEHTTDEESNFFGESEIPAVSLATFFNRLFKR